MESNSNRNKKRDHLSLEKKQTTETGLLYRGHGLQAEINEETREVNISFSSEKGVTRNFYDDDGFWRGQEYLSHADGAADLSRLKNMGAVLFNHDPNQIIGPVKSAKINTDSKRGEAIIGFDEDDLGRSSMSKIQSGSLRGVSFGYNIQEFKKIRDGETIDGFKGPGILGTRWKVYELTLTPIPADETVGVGRMLDLTGDIIESRTLKNETNKRQKDMEKDDVKKMIEEMNQGLEERISKSVMTMLTEQQKPKIRVDVETMQDLLGRAGTVSVECKGIVADMISDGKTENEILRFIYDTNYQKPDGNNQHQNDQDPGQKNKVESVSDEDFSRMICDPTEFSIN